MKTLLLILVLSCSANAGQMAATMPGLMGLWHMNEGSGTSIRDASGNNRPLTIYSGAWVTGRWGRGLVTGGVDMASSPSIAAPPNITMLAWVFMNSTMYASTEQQWVIQQPVNNTGDTSPFHHIGYGVLTAIDATPRIETAIVVGGTRYTGSHPYGLRSKYLGTWMHTAVTYNGSKLIAYLNGIALPGTLTLSGGISARTNPFWIGGYRAGGGTYRPCDGIIDEAAIFNRALSAGEVQRLYTEGLGRHSNAR